MRLDSEIKVWQRGRSPFDKQQRSDCENLETQNITFKVSHSFLNKVIVVHREISVCDELMIRNYGGLLL